MTCTWKWKTVCHAALPQELMRLTPSAPRRSLARAASRWQASATALRSAASTLSRSRWCARGITSACPRVAGAMSMKAIVRSSSSTMRAGSSPATILQKMHSGSLIAGGILRQDAAAGALRDERTRALERGGAGADLARVLRGAQLLEQLADAGAGGHAELARELVAAQQRPRRPLGTPAQRVGEQLAREPQVRADGLARAIAAGGQTVGDGQQRDVDLHRRARAQVLEHRRARERLWLVHEEASAQVMARERGDVLAQPLASAQPREHLARELRAARVVADERHAPVVGAHRARQRLGGVVQQRTPAQCLPARHLIGERLGEHLRDLALASGEQRTPRGVARARVAGELDGAVERLERVLVHVEVV